jgi:hypothetical protein
MPKPDTTTIIQISAGSGHTRTGQIPVVFGLGDDGIVYILSGGVWEVYNS